VSDIWYIGKPRGETARQLAPLVEELRKLGYEVDSPADLPRLRRRYRDAVPVLLEHLPRVTDRAVRESITRALSVPWARPAAIRPLLDEFHGTDDEVHRWVVGNALSVVADDSAFDDLVQIVREPRYRKAREMVVVALGNMNRRRDDALAVLTELLEDDDLARHALLGLQKLRDPRARPAVEQAAQHDDRVTRFYAKRVLEKLPRD
jgi:hypothetical protein